MKDILHAIKMLYPATTFISHKKIFKNTQKQTWNDSTFKSEIGRRKGLLQFANQNILDTATSQFV